MTADVTSEYGKVRLEDGRVLAFTEAGAPGGFPVFYFHGTPSCRIEVEFSDEAARQVGFRLIATDRPGFGRSSFQRHRRFEDWPGDILALAKHLEIDQFGVAGHSGAGPHLFACGVFLDPARLMFIGALGPWGPVASPEIRASLNRLDRAFADAARRFPLLMRLGFAPMGWAARYAPSLFIWLLKASVSDSDKAILEDENVVLRFAAMQKEAFRQGSRGAAHEAFIAYSEWSFDIACVGVPTHIRLGEDDIFVSAAMGRHIANNIPNVDFQWVQGAGHLKFDCWIDIFEACRKDIESPTSPV